MEQKTKLPKNNMVPRIGLSYKSCADFDCMPKVSNASDAYKVLIDNWNTDTLELLETFVIMPLNTAKKVLGFIEISTGGITGTVIDIRLIFSAAMLTSATAIIVAHNHPSSQTKPSQADFKITEKLVAAGRLLDIQVLDHIIVTPKAYFSFGDEGLL